MGEMYESKITDALQSLNFTRYESEVYTALVELGEATARDISNNCSVPREKIYYVLRRMEDDGLVRLVNKNPIRYVALPPKQALREKVEQMKSQVGKIDNAVEVLDERYTNVKEKIERKNMNIWEVSDSRSETMGEVLEGCRERMVCFLSIDGSRELVGDHYDLLKKLAKDDVQMEVYGALDDSNVRSLGKLSNVSDIHVTGSDGYGFSVFVVDDENGLIVEDGRDESVHFIEPRMARLFSSLVRFSGEDGVHFDGALRLLTQGVEPTYIADNLNKESFFEVLSRSYSTVARRARGSEGRRAVEELGKALLEEMSEVGQLSSLDAREAVDRVASLGSMVDDYEVDVSFDEENSTLTYTVPDPYGELEEAVEGGLSHPPDVWSLIVQELIRERGYGDVMTTVLYDKETGTWDFVAKFEPPQAEAEQADRVEA